MLLQIAFPSSPHFVWPFFGFGLSAGPIFWGFFCFYFSDRGCKMEMLYRMLQSGQILFFFSLSLGNFIQLLFFDFQTAETQGSPFLIDSVSDVHINRRCLHQRLCSLQLRLLFLRKPKERNTPCCQLTQGMTCYLFHWFVCFGFFFLKEGIIWGMQEEPTVAPTSIYFQLHCKPSASIELGS